MKGFIRSWTSRDQRNLLVALATLLCFAILLGSELYLSRQTELANAERNLENLARVLDRQALATIEKIDVVLRQGVHMATPLIAREDATSKIEQELAFLLDTLPESQSLRIINTEGYIAYDAKSFRSKSSVADRAYFIQQRDNPQAGLVISEPIFARFTSNWVITVSRRLNHPDGSFAGLLQAAIKADYFADFYKTLSVNKGVIALYDKESRLIARFPYANDELGKARPASLRESMLASGLTSGAYINDSRIDQVRRLYAFRQVETLPLLVVTGISINEILSEWRHKATLYAFAFFAISLLFYFLISSLRQQSAAALKQAKSKSTFLANMSHEIRTPLNGIIGFVHLLRSQELSSKQQDQLRKIDLSASHLLHIVNDILDLSKIEAGKLQLETAPFFIDNVLATLASILQPQAEAKGLHLQVFNPLPRTILLGDATRLTQALLNFGNNAIKFSERGTIVLRILPLSDGDSTTLRFEVEDQGIGLAPEQQKRLFQAFEQADTSTTRKHGGSGLGLAITQQLVSLMGGETGVISSPGKGSLFWFTARFGKPAVDAQDAPALPDEPVVTGRQQNHGLQGQRLLLVEDEPINREIALELLADRDLRIDTAANGHLALACAARTQYDLILMDMHMPEMDGLDATKAIRQLAGYATTPIIAMTANVLSEDKERCLAAGMNEHLSKPINPDRLQAAINRWLQNKPNRP